MRRDRARTIGASVRRALQRTAKRSHPKVAAIPPHVSVFEFQPLESRIFFAATIANFANGNGTSSYDQFAGTSGSGWVGAWQTSTSNATFDSPTAAPSSPSQLASGGNNYLDAPFRTTAANGVATHGRGYSTTSDVNTGKPHIVEFDWRLDSNLTTFDTTDDRVVIFGNSAAAAGTGSSNTWAIAAYGATNGVVTAKYWGFQNSDKSGGSNQTYVNTGVELVQGRVYHFKVVVDPADKSYVATITDDQSNTFTSGTLGFRTNVTFDNTTNTYINFGSRRSSNGETTRYSFDSIKISPTAPAAPSSLNATAISSNRIDLSWTDNSGGSTTNNETAVEIERSTDNVTFTPLTPAAADATSYQSTGLSENTTYYYRIRATNVGGASSYTSVSSATTPLASPTAPSSLSATAASASQINLSWTDNSSNETGFLIETSTDGTTFSTLTTTAADATSYSNSGLSAGSRYYYRVSAVRTGATSSSTISANTYTLPPAPSGASANATSWSTVAVSWSDGTGETGYRIERSADGSTGWTSAGTVAQNATSFNDTGRSASTTYYYRVFATNTSGDSAASSVVSAATPAFSLNAPSSLNTSSVTSTTIDLSWTDNSSDETGFKIERKTGTNGTWALRDTVGAGIATYHDTGLSPTTQYFYRVYAYNGGGNSANSSEATATTSAASVQSTAAHFAGSSGTSQPDDYLGSSGAGWAGGWSQATSSGSFSSTGLTSTTPLSSSGQYFNGTFTASASNASGAIGRGYNSANGVDTSLPHVIQFKLRFNTSLSGFGNANDRIGAFGGDGVLSGTSSSNTWAIGAWGAANGSVAAKNWGFQNSDNAGSQTYVDTGVALVQNYVYDITVRVDPLNKNYTASIDDGNGHTYSSGTLGWRSNATYGPSTTTYLNFGVRRASNGQSANYSVDEVVITGTPPAPTSPVASAASPTRIDVSWTDNSTHETGFVVERSTNSGSTWSTLTTTAAGATSYADTTVTEGARYDYRVYAINGTLNSTATSSVNATTPLVAPTSLSATPISTTRIDLTWTDNSSNETNYTVERATAGGSFSALTTSLTAGSNSYSDTTVSPGVSYEYRVRATNSIAASAYSNTANQTAPSSAPYGGTPHALPGTVEAEDFDTGGDGIAWHDLTSGNGPGDYRTGVDVDIEDSTGGGYNVGSAQEGEWLQYTVDVASAGTYQLGLRVAADTGYGGVVHVEFDGDDKTGPIAFPVTGGWQSWQTVWTSVTLAAGEQAMRLYFDDANDGGGDIGNVDSIRLVVPVEVPTDLTATPASDSEIDLEWTDTSTSEAGFRIERSTDGTTFTLLTTVAADVETYTDTGLDDGTTYYYRVSATNDAGDSDPSSIADATTPLAIPDDPTGLIVTQIAGTGYLRVGWVDASSTETGFEIERRETVGGSFALLATVGVDAISFVDTTVSPETSYTYRVRAVNDSVTSDYADEVAATADAIQIPFDDAFDRPDGSFIGPAWIENSGSLVISDGRVTSDTSGGEATLSGVSAEDMRVVANIFMTNGSPGGGGGDVGVIARWSVDGEYRATIQNVFNVTKFVKIQRRVSSTWSDLYSANIDTAFETGELRLDVVGSELKMYIDDHLVGYATDSAITSGSAGIFSMPNNKLWDITVDNLAAPSTVATLPFTDDFERPGTSFVGPYDESGDWVVTNGQLRMLTGDASIALRGAVASDVSVSADLLGEGLAERVLGIDARISGTNRYRAQVTSVNGGLGWFSIRKQVEGTWTTLRNELVLTGLGVGKLRFEVSGNALALFFNDQLIVSTTDSSITQAGGVGLYGSHGYAGSPDINVAGGHAVFGSIAVDDVRGTSMREAVEAVSNDVKFEPYAGAMKGPKATAQAESGNAWDQASLLVERLRQRGYTARFVYGRVEAKLVNVERWLGVKDATQAEAVLEAAGLHPDAPSGGKIEFDHTWVEAYLRSGDGFAWQTFDPSWKYRNLQPGVADPFASLPFDLTEPGGLLATDESPLDYYARRLGKQLAAQSKSLGEVAYDGPIIQRSYDQLLKPAPYTVVSSTNADEVPTNLNHRVLVHVEKSGGSSFEHELIVPRDGLETISLSASEGIYSLTVGLNSFGALDVEDNDLLTITIEHRDAGFDPGSPDESLRHTFEYQREAGATLALGLNAGQVSDERIREGEADLNRLSIRSIDGTQLERHMKREYVAKLLALTQMKYSYAVEQGRKTLAGLTGVLPVRAWVESGLMTGSGLSREIYTPGENLQYPVLPERVRTDNANVGTPVSLVPISTGWLNSGELNDVSMLIGAHSSAMESHVIEGVVNADAISTIDGFQWAVRNDIEVRALTGGDDLETVLPGLTTPQRDAIEASMGDGFTVIAALGHIELPRWQGAVWIEERTVDGRTERGYVVMRDGGRPERGGDSEDDAAEAPVDQTPLDPWDMFGTPANPANGNAIREETDFTLPSVGLPLQFSRHYDSYFDPNFIVDPASRMVDRGLGVGWTFSYGDFLQFVGKQVQWTTPGGIKLAFRQVGDTEDYVSPSGDTGKFEDLGERIYSHTAIDGTVHLFERPVDSNYAMLTSISDRNGNTLTFEHNEDQHLTAVKRGETTLLSIDYWNDSDPEPGASDNHIRTVTDYSGREWNYTYKVMTDADGLAERSYLTKVVGPADDGEEQATTEYNYYGSKSGDLVRSARLHGLLRTVTDGNTGATRNYAYYANRRVFSIADTLTEVEDRTQYLSYDLYHRATTLTDYRGSNTTINYTPDFQAYETILPDGSRTQARFGGIDDAGVFHDGTWKLDLNGNDAFNEGNKGTFTFGEAGDQPVVGDWDGDGWDQIGVFRVADGRRVFILDTNGTFADESGVDEVIDFGPATGTSATEHPVVGDWNRDGVTDLGVYADGEFILDSDGDKSQEISDRTFVYVSGIDASTNRPIAGDFDGDGSFNVGVFDGVQFLLDVNDDGTTTGDPTYTLSEELVVQPVVGHWNSDGTTDLGLYVEGFDGGGRFTLDGNDDHLISNIQPDRRFDFRGLYLQDDVPQIPVIGNWSRDGGRSVQTSSTDPLGRVERSWHDENGNVVHQLGSDGMRTTYTFEPTFNNVTEIRVHGRGDRPDDRVTRFTYDEHGNSTVTEDALGALTIMSHDTQGRVTSITKPRGTALVSDVPTVVDGDFTTYYAYQEDTELVTEETVGAPIGSPDPLSIITREYDTLNRLTKTIQPGSEDGTARETTFEVDDVGQVISSTTTTSTGPQVAVFEYHNGQVVSSTDAADRTTSTTYDLLGRPIRVTYDDGSFTETEYNAEGNTIAKRDELGRLTRFFYDQRGRLVQTLYADGSTTLARYDGAGQAMASTDALGRESRTTYDARGRKLTDTLPDPDGGSGPLDEIVTSYEYDDVGLVKQINPGDVPEADRTSTFTLDDLGRVRFAVQPGNILTETRYDANGNVVGRVSYDTTGLSSIPSDPAVELADEARLTVTQYDALDRMISETLPDPDGPSGPLASPGSTVTYDLLGNPVNNTDALGRTTATLFDALNRVVATGMNERDAVIDATSGSATITLSGHGLVTGDRALVRGVEGDAHYVGVFTVTRVDDDHFTFTTAGSVGGTISAGSARVSVSAISTAYDAAGNVATSTDARGNVAIYEYDARDRRTLETLPDETERHSAYDAAGNLVSRTDGRGNVTNYEYDTRNRQIVQRLPDADGNVETDDAPVSQTTYNAAGRIVITTDPLGRTTVYAIDALGRTIATGLASQGATVAAVDDESAEVSLASHGLIVGQRVVIAGSGDPAVDGLRVVTAVTTDTFTFDTDGRSTLDAAVAVEVASNVSSTTYRTAGQVASATDALGRETTFEYDLASRQISSTLPDPDGSGPLAAPEVGTTYDSFGNVTSTTDALNYTTDFEYDRLNRKVRVTLPDPDLNGSENPGTDGDGPLSRPETNFAYDAAGNIVATTDTLGRVSTTLFDVLNRPAVSAAGGRAGTSGAAVAGTATVHLTHHGFATGDRVLISGAATGALNGVFIATVTGADIFTVSIPSGAGTIADESVTVFTSVNSSSYDASGNVVSTTDPRGNVTRVEYDSLNRKTAIVSPSPDGSSDPGPTVSMTYDENGNLETTTDARGNAAANPEDAALFRTTYVYDTLNRKISQTLPDADGNDATVDTPITTYRYDKAGNVVAVTDPRGFVTETDYDDLNRVVAIRNATLGISSLTAFGTTVTATATGHGFSTGDHVVVQDAAEADYNGVFAIHVIDADTFTYELADAPSLFDAGGTPRVSAATASSTYDAVGNVISTTDSFGATTTYVYDDLNRKITETRPTPDGNPAHAPVLSFEYDARGAVVSGTDARGGETTFVYDGLGRKVKETSPDPDPSTSNDIPITVTTYDMVGNVLTVTDPRGTTSASRYDAINRVVGTGTVERAGTVSVSIDGLTATIDSDDHAITIGDRILVRGADEDVFNGVFTVTAVTTDTLSYALSTAAVGATGGDVLLSAFATSVTYDASGNVLTSTDARGRVSSHAYDALNRVTADQLPDADGNPLTTDDAPLVTYVYDENGNVVATTDALGNLSSDPVEQAYHTTTYAFDPLGRKRSETFADPDGADPLDAPGNAFNYDAVGNVIESTDAKGQTTTYAFDALGRKTRETLPDPDGNPSTANDAPVTTWGYDPNGNVRWTTSPLGNLPGANPAAAKPTDFTTFYEYDALNRQVRAVDPDPDGSGPLEPAVTRFGYNAAGDVLWEIDPLGNEALGASPTTSAIDAMVADNLHTRTHEYDGLGREIKTTLADADSNSSTADDAPITTFTYDTSGSVLSHTDADDNTTTYEYDALGRQVSEAVTAAFHGNVTRTREYDAVDNLVRTVDRNGRVRVFAYDDLDQQTSESWLDSSNSVIRTETFTYDVAGRLTSASDPDSEYAYGYDNLGQLTSVDNAGTPDAPRTVFSYANDPTGLVTDIRIVRYDAANPGGIQDLWISNTYDLIGRTTRIEQTAGDSISLPADTVAEKRVDYAYDVNGQVLSITRYNNLGGTGSAAVTTTQTFDDAGRLATIEHAGPSHTTTYEGPTSGSDMVYDVRGRLLEFNNSRDGTTTFEYDANDQLTGADHPTDPDEDYAYDAAGNRIGGAHSTGADNRLESDDTYDYTYDEEGNVLTRTDRGTSVVNTYTYDHRNRLIQVITSGTNATVNYTYDVNDRRIAKSVDTNGDSTPEQVERYALDGDRTAIAFDAAGVVVTRYLHGPGADEVLADETPGASLATEEVRWLLPDHQGSIRDIAAGSDGTYLRHITYTAFGEVVQPSLPAGDLPRFLYTGQELDAETGLYFFNARYYDPASGRYFSQDPMGYEGGDGNNLYRYVGNNVTNLTDPTGRIFESLWELTGDITPGFEEVLGGSAHLFSDWFGSGYFGLDLGFINIGWGFHDDVATMDVGFAAMRYHVEFADGEWHDQVGLHIGFGVGPLQVGIDYMGGVTTVSASVGPVGVSYSDAAGFSAGVSPASVDFGGGMPTSIGANIEYSNGKVSAGASGGSRLGDGSANAASGERFAINDGFGNRLFGSSDQKEIFTPNAQDIAASNVAKAVNDGDYARNNAAEKMLDNAAPLASAAPAAAMPDAGGNTGNAPVDAPSITVTPPSNGGHYVSDEGWDSPSEPAIDPRQRAADLLTQSRTRRLDNAEITQLGHDLMAVGRRAEDVAELMKGLRYATGPVDVGRQTAINFAKRMVDVEQRTGDVLAGYFVDAPVSAVEGTAAMIRQTIEHPVDTYKAIDYALANPGKTVDAAWNAAVKKWESGDRGKGEIVGTIVQSVVPIGAKGIDKIREFNAAVTAAEDMSRMIRAFNELPRAPITNPARLLPAPVPRTVRVAPTTPARTFYVNRAGEALSSTSLARQGASSLAGDFRGLRGAGLDDIISRVPADWTRHTQRAGNGLLFKDAAGAERLRLHGPSSRAPVGSNSRAGWTMRVTNSAGQYLDDAGRVVQSHANDGHIPIAGNPNAR